MCPALQCAMLRANDGCSKRFMHCLAAKTQAAAQGKSWEDFRDRVAQPYGIVYSPGGSGLKPLQVGHSSLSPCLHDVKHAALEWTRSS